MAQLTAALALLAAAARAQAPPAPGGGASPAGPVTWSKVTWKPCTDAEEQKWDFAAETGLWSDRLTGRCMSILDKQQPRPGSNFGPVVLDVCGGSDYSGTPSGQKWSPEPATALTSGAPCDLHSPLPPTNCESAPHRTPTPTIGRLDECTYGQGASTCPTRISRRPAPRSKALIW